MAQFCARAGRADRGCAIGLAQKGQFWPSCALGQMGGRGKMRHLIWAIPMALALAGCGGASLGGMFKQKTASPSIVAQTAAPLDTATIQTQTLAPAAAGSAPATGRVIGAAPAAPATPALAATPAAPAPQNAAAIGAAAAAALKKTSPEAAPATQAAPPAPAAKPSPEEQTCLSKGGRWEQAGNTVAKICVQPAKDAGKSCSKESDCSSQCLARSRSCAPFWPIFGCSEVIQNNGAVVTLCIE